MYILTCMYICLCTLVDAYTHMHVSTAIVHGEVSGLYV